MTIPTYLPKASDPLRVAMRKSAIVVTLLAMQLQWMAPAMADIYQKPLLSTSANTVLPNFVLTLDNSESMALNHLPEDFNTVNTKQVGMGGTNIIWMHPDDTTSYELHKYLKNAAGVVPGTVTGQCATAYECQMRSPEVNTIYYNPAVLYLPWPSTTNPATRLPAASFTKAYFDPLKQSATDTGWTDLSSVGAKTAQWCTSASTTSPNCTSATQQFNPAIFYTLNSSTSDPTLTSSYTKNDLNSPPTVMWSSRHLYPARTDCAVGTSCTIEQERQNFANWFTYHRSRILLTKGGISEAFANLDNKLRLGWGAMEYAATSNTVDGKATNGGPIQGVREFTSSHKQAFLTWLQQKTLWGSTPTRFSTAGVGQYFQRSDTGSPWRDQPDASVSSPILGCRRAAHILTTDGYYNDDGGVGGNYPGSPDAVGEVDNTKATINNITYDPALPGNAPYKDGVNKNSLADIAMKYWAFPAAMPTNAGETVSETTSDPATWLHLNQFMVGLGVSGTVDPADVAAMKAGSKPWPAIVDNKTKIYDMIHAATNSRGSFISVNDGQALKDAIAAAIQGGTPTTKQESGASTAGVTAIVGDTIYVPSYNANGWYGDIVASTITATSGSTGTLTTTELWKASERRPAASARNIVSYSGTNAVAFTAANLASFDTIASTYQTEAFINYIRGDDSDNGVTFRRRNGTLPDFVNSTPTLIGGNLDMRYDQTGLPSGADTYRSFVNSKIERTPLLFMGGNGGMLHAFDATKSATSGGSEVFAYIPRAALPNLHLLAQFGYGHHFYVDGPLTEADAYITKSDATSPAWRNILIGTMGAGGRDVFAIDVTGTAHAVDQTGGSVGIGASQVMWDISGNNDLGYVTSRVEVGYVQDNGGWYAFIGNGHDAPSGRAALLVVDLSTGAIVKTFALPGASDSTSSNGLSGVSLIRNSKAEVVGAYAGDLHGQLWRFEFSGPPASKDASGTPVANPLWKVGFGGHPLYVARRPTTDASTDVVQKISAAPKHFKLPSTAGTGNLVTFGTGRLVASADTSATNQLTETFYAILDETVGSSPDTSPLAAGGRDLLQQQTFLPKLTGNPLIQMSHNAVSFTGDSKKYGWYVDLAFSSANTSAITETGVVQHPKVIYQPQIVNRLVFFTAIVPPDANNACTSSSGSQYTFLLPVLNGGQLDVRTWDTNGDGLIDSNDAIGQGYVTVGTDGESRLKDTADRQIGVDLTAGTGSLFNKCAAGGCEIRDRVWQRIIKPPF